MKKVQRMEYIDELLEVLQGESHCDDLVDVSPLFICLVDD